MDQAAIAQKEKEMRERYPKIFSHPELKPGEIWYGDQVVDLACMNIGIYKSRGIPSARLGKEFRKLVQNINTPLIHYPVFFNLHEYLEAEEKHKTEKSG